MPRANTMLVAGVPLKRGTPDHIERQDLFAATNFDKRGKVTEIYTPQHPLLRVHELMHARHTVKKRYDRMYKGIPNNVANICEDVRIHTRHWPWRDGQTPKSIANPVEEYLLKDSEDVEKRLTEHPEERGTWPDFATRFRACGVNFGLHGYSGVNAAGFADSSQVRLAAKALQLCRDNEEGKAAQLLTAAFCPPVIRSGDGKPHPFVKTRRGGKCEMEVIELPHTEHITDATVGTRLATSGSRMYRPALRRPIIPQRMFVRRAAIEPGGTILIDASGSMGDFDEVTKWAEKAPFGTIAYYAGTDSPTNAKGWLYVYARNGRRAKEIVAPPIRGNTVDGPAMDWLMQQPQPRIMVTDRQFCGAYDSDAQIVRLRRLEREKEIKVVNYCSGDD